MLQWIRKSSVGTDVTMSICVGAIVLARTGLLDGKSATTHHDAYKHLAKEFPKIHLIRGVRFVEEGNLATSGGLACGIDPCHACGRKIFWEARGGRHGLQPGVSWQRVERSKLESDLCPHRLKGLISRPKMS
jgi:DJ-1/PfpI family